MSIYKEASRRKLRFTTSRGSLSSEQLWSLSLNELDALAINLEDQYEDSGKKSYLTKRSDKDSLIKLMADIVIDVLSTKLEEQESAATTLERKQQNEIILQAIAEKEHAELQGKSVEELRAMLS